MDYEIFKERFFALSGINLNYYKENQMKRRIISFIDKKHFSGYDTFIQALSRDHALLDEFLKHITINVTEFFRNPAQWDILEKEILPQLLSKNKNLKIWSSACSTGDEPYTLAMIMSRLMPLSNIQILATDLDTEVISLAKKGIYSSKAILNVPADLKSKYFTPFGTMGEYAISDEIKRCVTFSKLNLLKDRYPTDLDLIICRNVVIYFTEEAKQLVYKNFHSSLQRNGILFVGNTEQIVGSHELGYTTEKTFFYKKQ